MTVRNGSGDDPLIFICLSEPSLALRCDEIRLTSVMGVFKNPSMNLSLIPLSVIMMCECPALLLVGSLILKETKALYSNYS